MADKSSIEWTDATWNIITGCTLVDEGCRHCYAAHLITSWPAIGNHPSRQGLARKNAAGESKFTGEVRFNEQWLDQPLRWRKPRKIFVCAHGDLFHESVPDEWIDKVFAVMALCPQHTFQVLTKRPERARAYLTGGAVRRIVGIYANSLMARAQGGVRPFAQFDIACDKIGLVEEFPDADIVPRLLDRGLKAGWPLPNVWLGTSISDQASSDLRIPQLLACPAAIRFISAEPLLGPVDLTLDGAVCLPCPNSLDGLSMDPETGAYECCSRCDHTGIGDEWGIDWVIVGGESGPHARPMHPDWARSLRDQCAAASVPFLFKQWGEWLPMGQSGFTAWLAANVRNNGIGKVWLGIACFNDGNGGPETHRIGPCATQGFGSMGLQASRVGKKTAGRLLDGVTHDGFPIGRGQ